MTRPANAIDMWRGFALVTIFINHVPGMVYARWTFSSYSIADSADLFVFLAGWSLRYVVGTDARRNPTRYVVMRLAARAFTIYVAQVFITALAIAMLAFAAIILDNPLLLEWHNAASVFFDPVPTHIGLVLITHQLGYFDILPLYVVLMLFAPLIAIIDRYTPRLLLPLSLTIYVLALTFQLNPLTWPVEGAWFFNPLAWQLIFVLGFVIARKDGVIGEFLRRNISVLRIIGFVVIAIGLYFSLADKLPDPTTVPRPRLFFIADKTYMTPIRLFQFLALVAVFSGVYPYIEPTVPRIARFFALLGRNSLQVFCVGSLLSLAGQITRFVWEGYFSVDTIVVIFGVSVMALTAWLNEWRDRAAQWKKRQESPTG